MKFAICNLGCKVNNYEANWYSQQLSLKYEEVPFGQVADIYIINSCTVTNTAGSKSRQMLHKAKKLNPKAVICMASCYVQMEYQNKDIFEDVDVLVGTKHKTMIPALIDQFLKTREKIVMVDEVNECVFEEMTLTQYNQTRAYLKIQDGCNQFCSFCVIPFARGRERSLAADKVIENAKNLVNGGHQELVLTGIHTGRYNDGSTNFTQLIKRLLAEVDGLKRIRISSIEITEISDELIELMKNDERIAHHLHIPIQSGCDEILKAMNRPYTTTEFQNRINQIKSQIPFISISTDVIVGFPGESSEDFCKTKEFLSKSGLSFLHVFPYAAKKHTPACELKNQVSEGEKKSRVAQLTVLSGQLYNDFVKSISNKKGYVLFEKQADGYWQGHNSEYVIVKVKSQQKLNQQFKMVSYQVTQDDCLIGRIEEN